MELREKLLTLRKANGMTQDELAKALYVSRQSVYKWESGKALPDIEKLKQICELFQVSADELLDIQKSEQPKLTPFQQRSAEEAIPTGRSVQKKKRICMKCIFILCLVGFSVFGAMVISHWQPAEVREAINLGIVPAELQSNLSGTVSEREFLCMLQKASRLQVNADSPMLTEAVNAATNEQLTREKTAYWLYCTHIWTEIDSDADLSIGTHEPPDPIAVRNVYEDLNAPSRSRIDSLDVPWATSLCCELAETDELFQSYDGTAEMDEAINAILYGPYYTSVTFCLAQRSFSNDKPIMETCADAFRAKDKITREKAVIAAYRLYGSW